MVAVITTILCIYRTPLSEFCGDFAVVLLKRFTPRRKTIMQTADPVAMFMIRIVLLGISPKETSIDLCKENIETNASAKDMFLSISIFTDRLRLDFTKLIDAMVILVKE